MAVEHLVDMQNNTIASGTIERFREEFRGEIIDPDDAQYDSARKVWNASVDRYPGMIAGCSGVADVIDAVNFARDNDVLIAIRGGGHNVGGRALCDGGIVVDMSHMKGIYVDPGRGTVRVQAGATLGDLDRETHVHGLAVPAGVVSKTGVAGLTLGGGVGWLVRKYGLTCDNVLSFEIVTANGMLLTASTEENEDLYWALRGGGGNFGVVTSFEYRTYPVATVLGGLIVHPRAHARDVLMYYRDFMRDAPEELTAYSGLLCTPDGTPATAVIVCYAGNLTEGERVIAPLREFGSPMLDAVQPLPFPAMQSLLDDAFPDGNQNYWKSTFIRELSDEVIELLIEHANEAASPLSSVLIEFYGGAASRVGATDTAFAHRQAEYDIGILAQWTDVAESQRHIDWARALAGDLERFSSGAYLLNFLDNEDDDTIRAAFGPNYERLVQIKTKYDPTNLFRVNQNIPPIVS